MLNARSLSSRDLDLRRAQKIKASSTARIVEADEQIVRQDPQPSPFLNTLSCPGEGNCIGSPHLRSARPHSLRKGIEGERTDCPCLGLSADRNDALKNITHSWTPHLPAHMTVRARV